MSDTENNSKRRKFLTRSTQILGGIGGVFALIPFLSTMSPSERAKSAGAPIEVDVSSIQPGMYKVFEWRGKPVWVVRRTQEMINQIADRDDKLSDPMSNEEFQPSYAKNKYRSIKPEFLVLVGVCTHLGCSPLYKPNSQSTELGLDWKEASSARVMALSLTFLEEYIKLCPRHQILRCRHIILLVRQKS